MLNPVHLRTLVEVIGHGSFAGAANRLGYTASAVSQQMAALEAAAGLPLFERTARSTRPTEAALAMARRAAPVFADLDAVLRAAHNAHEANVDEVTVALYASLARVVAPEILHDPHLVATGTRVRFSVHDPSAAIRALTDGDTPDLTVVYRCSSTGLAWPATLTEIGLGIERYRLLLPRAWDLHRDGAVQADALSGLPWALHHPGSSDATVMADAFRTAGILPRPLAYADDFEVFVDLVASGSAAALVPETVANAAPASTVQVDPIGLHFSRSLHALVSPTAPRAATDAVIEALRRAFERALAG